MLEIIRAYLEAVEGAFGGDVDYAMLVKLYDQTPEVEKRYSPAECIGARPYRIEGSPDPAHRDPAAGGGCEDGGCLPHAREARRRASSASEPNQQQPRSCVLTGQRCDTVFDGDRHRIEDEDAELGFEWTRNGRPHHVGAHNHDRIGAFSSNLPHHLRKFRGG